jgi:hypothetical protein
LPAFKQAADRPRAGGAICKVYPHGIEFIDHVSAIYGYALVIGAPSFVFLAWDIYDTWQKYRFDWMTAIAAFLMIGAWSHAGHARYRNR